VTWSSNELSDTVRFMVSGTSTTATVWPGSATTSPRFSDSTSTPRRSTLPVSIPPPVMARNPGCVAEFCTVTLRLWFASATRTVTSLPSAGSSSTITVPRIPARVPAAPQRQVPSAAAGHRYTVSTPCEEMLSVTPSGTPHTVYTFPPSAPGPSMWTSSHVGSTERLSGTLLSVWKTTASPAAPTVVARALVVVVARSM